MAGAELSGQLLGGSLQSFPGALRRAFENLSRRLVRKLSAQLSGGPPAGCREALRAAVRRFSAQLSRSSSDGGLAALSAALYKLSNRLSRSSPESWPEAFRIAAWSSPESSLEAFQTASGISPRSCLEALRQALAKGCFPASSLEALQTSSLEASAWPAGSSPASCREGPRTAVRTLSAEVSRNSPETSMEFPLGSFLGRLSEWSKAVLEQISAFCPECSGKTRKKRGHSTSIVLEYVLEQTNL